jgi:hypothetical protein
MKKQMMRVVNTTLFSKFFKASAFVLVLTGGYVAAQASPVSYAYSIPTPGTGNVQISHISSNDQSLVFQVKVANVTGERFQITVKDESNNTLYRGTFTGKDFAKKFVLPKGDLNKLSFIVRGASDNKTESFEINSNTKVVEEVTVTRIN